MTCSDGTDPPGTGPLDHVLSNLVVQVTAPVVVPFGGTVTYTGFRYAVTVAATPYGAGGSTLYAGPATHLVPEGQVSIGSSLGLPSPGRYTSLAADFGASDVKGNVGDVVSLPVQQLSAQWSVYFPPYGGYTLHEYCTPDPGTPPLATTVIGPPPGGASAGDEVIMAVRDQTTGTIVYQANAFVTSGNFVVDLAGDGIRIVGSATFPGIAGGSASLTVVASTKQIPFQGGSVGITTTVLSLSDPGAGIALHAAGQNTVYGGPPLGTENVYSVSGGTLLGNGHAASIFWEIRDLV
jgi:hypothetical protein